MELAVALMELAVALVDALIWPVAILAIYLILRREYRKMEAEKRKETTYFHGCSGQYLRRNGDTGKLEVWTSEGWIDEYRVNHEGEISQD